MSSNYPPGVTGLEPEIAGYPEEAERLAEARYWEEQRRRAEYAEYLAALTALDAEQAESWEPREHAEDPQ